LSAKELFFVAQILGQTDGRSHAVRHAMEQLNVVQGNGYSLKEDNHSRKIALKLVRNQIRALKSLSR
jgi:hypothetical protein